jgi:SAM-dependent methyltransferase
MPEIKDQKTADAFAASWNNLPLGSVYTLDQFEDWMLPLVKSDIENKTVLELGCGNAGLMVHLSGWNPSYLTGIDLGDSVSAGIKNMSGLDFKNWQIIKADLVGYRGSGFDLVYCIGVLHHLKDPRAGFNAVLANTKPEGRFHCWVYAREGNSLIVYLVDPLRKIVSRLPWWFTKYAVASPLAALYYVYAKFLSRFRNVKIFHKLPLFDYSLWIAKREYAFFRHVAFDQLVTPQTAYIKKEIIENWLSDERIDQKSVYIIMRNGNSWKFGGKKIV